MMLSNPSVAELLPTNYDEVTDTTDNDGPVDIRYLVEPEFADNQVSYLGADSIIRGFDAAGLVEAGRYFATPDGMIRIRDVDPYDAVALAPAAGVPQPVETVRAEILGEGGALAQELDAVVAPDNSVATLMLETGTGTYVRYAGDWQLLDPDSDSLEDMALVPVAPGAIDVYDAAENAQTTVSAGDLPTVSGGSDGQVIQLPSEPEPVSAGGAGGLTAAGVAIPAINGPEDLDLGLRFASAHPDARWYVAKRAAALGHQHMIPTDWYSPGVVLPFETRAAV
jgi:hypothetical protein